MAQKKRMSDNQIGINLIKFAETEEEKKARNSYVITRVLWILLCVYYTLDIVIPRYTGKLVIENEWVYVAKILVPAFLLATLEVLWIGKPWHTYLEKIKRKR